MCRGIYPIAIFGLKIYQRYVFKNDFPQQTGKIFKYIKKGVLFLSETHPKHMKHFPTIEQFNLFEAIVSPMYNLSCILKGLMEKANDLQTKSIGFHIIHKNAESTKLRFRGSAICKMESSLMLSGS